MDDVICHMDDVIVSRVIVSIAISITELYGQLSGKRVVLCITKAVKCSLQVWCLETTYVHLPGMLFMVLELALPSKLALVGGKKARENKQLYCFLWVFCHSAWVVAHT